MPITKNKLNSLAILSIEKALKNDDIIDKFSD